MLDELGQTVSRRSSDQALNERDYGDLTGLNKDDARKKWGEEQVHIWRRSYDVPPPGGESLKDTLARALPYYMVHIQPDVLSGKTVLVSAHGNSLRALIMALEGLTPEQILKRELETGVPIVYRLKADSRPNRLKSKLARCAISELRIRRWFRAHRASNPAQSRAASDRVRETDRSRDRQSPDRLRRPRTAGPCSPSRFQTSTEAHSSPSFSAR